MKAYLIDPVEKSITEVEHNDDYREIYKFIDAETFTVVPLHHCLGDVIYVDDMGLLKKGLLSWKHEGWPHSVLVGKGLILGSGEDGESIAPKLSIEKHGEFLSFAEQMITGGFGPNV